MIVHTSLLDSDVEVLQDYCNEHHITVSALVKTLINDFLETNDKRHVEHITNEAKKIKPGRPKIYY